MNRGIRKDKDRKKGSKIACLLLVMLFAVISMTGCGGNSSKVAASADSVIPRIEVTYSEEDMDGTWDDSLATKIGLKGSSYTIDGSGATADGKILKISKAGTYVFSGTLTDGQIQVLAGEEDTVKLVLDGANLTCQDGAVIYASQSKKTILTLAEDSVNRIADGSAYIDAGTDAPNAAIFSNGDLTINGAGSLVVVANYKDGITTKDDLVITDGKISLTAVNDGLKGRDSIAINNGTFKIKVNGDGIQANNDEELDKGWISIDGGIFSITATNDGIQAETQLQIAKAKLSIITGGGSVNASTNKDGSPSSGWGNW